MADTNVEKVKFTVERKVKGTRRIDVYLFLGAVVFIATFLIIQILLGVYYI